MPRTVLCLFFVLLGGGIVSERSANAVEGRSRQQFPVPHPQVLSWEPENAALATYAEAQHKLTSLAVRPSGREVATVSATGEVLLIGLPDLKTMRRFPAGGRFCVPAISSDDRFLAVATDDFAIDVRALDTLTSLFKLSGHEDRILRIAWSPDRRWIASGGFDRSVCLWDVERRVLKRKIKVDGESIAAIAFSPDSETLAIRTQGETVLLWNMTNLTESLRLAGQGNNCSTIAFTPDNKAWATMRDVNTIALRRAPTDEVIATFPANWGDVAVAPDGKRIAIASGETMRLYQLPKGELLHEFRCHGDWINAHSLTPDSQKLVTISGAGRLALWDVASITALKNTTLVRVTDTASVHGRYQNLQRIYDAPGDRAQYGEYCEYGLVEKSFGHQMEYWVYSAPKWYVFERSRIGLGAPPTPLPDPSLQGNQRRIWIAFPHAVCAGSAVETAGRLHRQIPQIKRAMFTYTHRFRFTDADRANGQTGILEVGLDAKTSTEQALELLQANGWALQHAAILAEDEVEAAGLLK